MSVRLITPLVDALGIQFGGREGKKKLITHHHYEHPRNRVRGGGINKSQLIILPYQPRLLSTTNCHYFIDKLKQSTPPTKANTNRTSPLAVVTYHSFLQSLFREENRQPNQSQIPRRPLHGSKINCHLERYKKREEITKMIRRNDYSSIDVDSKFEKAGITKIRGE